MNQRKLFRLSGWLSEDRHTKEWTNSLKEENKKKDDPILDFVICRLYISILQTINCHLELIINFFGRQTRFSCHYEFEENVRYT